jgi:hypothetical protein
MFNLKTVRAYQTLDPLARIKELTAWVRDEVEPVKALILEVAKMDLSKQQGLETVLGTPIDELPKLINDYEDDSVCHKVLKHRLALKIPEGLNLMDTSWYADLVRSEITHALENTDELAYEDQRDLNSCFLKLLNLKTVATILGDEGLVDEIKPWMIDVEVES